MNLVQINERLKDLPVQVLQQYANGMNPEVPPYLALGELQRREMSQKQMATAQGGQQGPQPSIKEQVEQKAGLMALQQMQQQQVAQQMQQPRGPMPAPAGVPQPEPQPEAMMARGGLAGIPVRRDMFEYAGGGIIAFAKAGEVEDPRRERKEGESFSDFRKRMFDLDLQLQREKNAAEESGRESERQRRLAERGEEFAVPPSPFMERPPLPQPAREPKVTSQGPGTPVVPRRPIETTGLPEALKKIAPPAGPDRTAPPMAGATPMPGAPRPVAPAPAAAPQPGLPLAAQSQQDEVAKLSLDAVRTPAKAMTPEEAMAQEGKFAAQYGLDKKFGEEERGLLAAMKQRQAQYAADRPSAELGAVLRGFGQGYGGAGAAGERASRETYDMDIANQREMINAINAINKENLTTGRERYKSSGNLFGESEKSASAANRERSQTLGQMRGQDIVSATAAANRLSDMERAKMDRAVRMAEINNPGSSSNIRTEYLKMMDQVFALEDKGEKDKAEALRKRADARLSAGGGSGAAGVGAERNDISRKRLQIQTWKEIRDSSSDQAAIQEAEKNILQLARDIAKIEGGAGGGSAPKVMTQADVLATAKSSGKTPQQVIEAAKARGYEIK
jgi:hypothetical protein